METSETGILETTESESPERPVNPAGDAINSTIEQRQGESSKPLVLRRRGAPRRNKNGFRHGGRALQFARQRGLPIDGRSTAGKVEADIYSDLLVRGKVIEQSE